MIELGQIVLSASETTEPIILLNKLVSLIIVVSVFARPLLDAVKVDVLAKSLSAIIVVSTLAPRTGEYIRTREYHTERLRERFDDSIGDQMAEFRRDLRLIYVRNSEHNGDIPSKPELVRDIKASRRKIRRRHDIGELVVAVAIALLALVVSEFSLLGGVGLLLGLYSLLLPISMFMRNTVIDTLAYAGEPIEEGYEPVLVRNRRALIFMKGWNRMLVRRESQMHKLIFISAVKGEFILGYELDQDFMEMVCVGEMEMEDAFDEIVDEQMGEYPESFTGSTHCNMGWGWSCGLYNGFTQVRSSRLMNLLQSLQDPRKHEREETASRAPL